MAAQIALVRRDDFVADQETLALWSYTNGIALADNGWAQARAAAGDTSVMETLTIQVRGSTPDNLAANLQALDLKLKEAYWYANPQDLYGVWLRVQQPRETNARQALVLSAKLGPAALWSFTAQNGAGAVAAGNPFNFVEAHALALERMPWWEGTAALDYSQGGAGTLNSLGGTWDYSTYGGGPGAVPGDQPARIAQATLAGAVGVGPLTKCWVGFRTNRFGNRANFVPAWNMHFSVDAVRSDTDTTKVSDATAKDGFNTTTTFATVATMLRRNTLRVSDFIPGSPNDARGTFMVLLRAKLSAGSSSVNVRLADGYISSQTFAVRPRVNITSTSYYIYEMGTVKIPSPGRAINSYDVANYALGLDAERISGAASLIADCFILIPMDEGYLTTDQPDAKAADGIGGAGGSGAHFVFERPDGAVQGIYLSVTPAGNIITRYFSGLPTGNGIAVVAAQRLASSVKADTISLEFQVYSRWATLRGAS